MNIKARPSVRVVGRSLARALVWSAALISLVILINAAGIHLAGSIRAWEEWMAGASSYFLIWRLCLYGLTVLGWLWMRRRLLARERSAQACRRLLRTEMAAVAAIVALEGSRLWQAG